MSELGSNVFFQLFCLPLCFLPSLLLFFLSDLFLVQVYWSQETRASCHQVPLGSKTLPAIALDHLLQNHTDMWTHVYTHRQTVRERDQRIPGGWCIGRSQPSHTAVLRDSPEPAFSISHQSVTLEGGSFTPMHRSYFVFENSISFDLGSLSGKSNPQIWEMLGKRGKKTKQTLKPTLDTVCVRTCPTPTIPSTPRLWTNLAEKSSKDQLMQ